jgi:hypothetical protein
MMHVKALLHGVILFLLCRVVPAGGSQVDVAASGTPPAGTVFTSVLDLNQKPGSFVPQLRNAIEANSLDWPVSFYASWNGAKGPGGCTAALVGPEVLITAAHCVPTDGNLSFKFGIKTYKSQCDQHPDYLKAHPDESADFAMCVLSEAFDLPLGFRFETVAAPPFDKMVGMSVVLTGFGCTSDIASVGMSDGKYRIGVNAIVQTSASSPPRPPFSASYYSPSEMNNLFTANTGVNICPGDSGGPAFQIVVGPELGTQYPNRVLIGVNSRVAYADTGHLVWGPSIISSTSGPSFTAWAKSWANGKAHWSPGQNRRKIDVGICGLVGALQHCRGSGA